MLSLSPKDALPSPSQVLHACFPSSVFQSGHQRQDRLEIATSFKLWVICSTIVQHHIHLNNTLQSSKLQDTFLHGSIAVKNAATIEQKSSIGWEVVGGTGRDNLQTDRWSPKMLGHTPFHREVDCFQSFQSTLTHTHFQARGVLNAWSGRFYRSHFRLINIRLSAAHGCCGTCAHFLESLNLTATCSCELLSTQRTEFTTWSVRPNWGPHSSIFVVSSTLILVYFVSFCCLFQIFVAWALSSVVHALTQQVNSPLSTF